MAAHLIRVEMLGAFNVRQGDRLITRFRYQKAAALLAFLAFYPTRMHSREELIEGLWPEFSPDAGRNNLSNILSSLRHQLEPPGTPAGAVLIADRFKVGLRSEAVATDVADFEDRLRAAERETDEALQMLRYTEVMALYAGPLLPGFYDEWVGVQSQRLSDALLQAARRLIRLLAKGGEREQALEIARRSVRVDPLREEAHRDLMQLYVAMGRPAAALRQYRELEGILASQLGTAPSASTRKWIAELRENLAANPYSEGGGALAQTPEAKRTTRTPAPPDREATPSSGKSRLQRADSSALQPGTVTFLVLAAGAPGAAGDPAMGRSDRETQAAVIRGTVAQHRGQVVQITQRELSIGFPSASDALCGALAVWKALETSTIVSREIATVPVDEEPTPPLVQGDPRTLSATRPRFALHTGDVQAKRNGHSESVQIQAQRLALAGHPGQILCSETTAALLRRDLQLGAQLVDLGLYRLRGGDEAERVWQIAISGMHTANFPPLRAEAGTPSHLPPPLTRFFGRDAELGRLLALLRPVSMDFRTEENLRQHPTMRLVTLTGPGGMGKTRLALEAGARLEADWEGAVWFVPLADLSDAALIPSALVSVLGLPRSGSIEPLEQVVVSLAARPSFLILDNMEHLVEKGAQLVNTLLLRVPALTCLVTSRQRLEIAGEHEMALMPLPVPATADDAPRSRRRSETSSTLLVVRFSNACRDFSP